MELAVRWKVFFGSFALGVGSTLLLVVLLMIPLGASRAAEVVFGYTPAIFVIVFGALWYPFVKRRLK